MTPDSQRIIETIQAIPRGHILSYGEVARRSGLPNGARQVARILHSCSGSHGLPWWRVVRANRSIGLPRGDGFEEQKARLEAEGLSVDAAGRIKPGAADPAATGDSHA